jgi:hypothetical protein
VSHFQLQLKKLEEAVIRSESVTEKQEFSGCGTVTFVSSEDMKDMLVFKPLPSFEVIDISKKMASSLLFWGLDDGSQWTEETLKNFYEKSGKKVVKVEFITDPTKIRNLALENASETKIFTKIGTQEYKQVHARAKKTVSTTDELIKNIRAKNEAWKTMRSPEMRKKVPPPSKEV